MKKVLFANIAAFIFVLAVIFNLQISNRNPTTDFTLEALSVMAMAYDEGGGFGDCPSSGGTTAPCEGTSFSYHFWHWWVDENECQHGDYVYGVMCVSTGIPVWERVCHSKIMIGDNCNPASF